jgi:hypothetical protein
MELRTARLNDLFAHLARKHPKDDDYVEHLVREAARQYSRAELTEEMKRLEAAVTRRLASLRMKRQLELVKRARRRHFLPLNRRWL